MSADEALQREITRTALESLDGTRFALAGSGAIREHGIVDRPTEDIDLFTPDVDVARFGSAVDELVTGLREAGHSVDEIRRVDQYARLHVTTVAGQWVDIDLGVDWREGEPVTLDIGPVLSLQDAIGNKISALYSRGEARDYLDVDAIRASGKFTDAQLISSAKDRDPGFEVPLFVAQLEQVHRIAPERAADYGYDAMRLESIMQRFDKWAAKLRSEVAEAETSG